MLLSSCKIALPQDLFQKLISDPAQCRLNINKIMFSATLLTDGFWEYLTALLTHYGQWVQPPRRQAQGPAPKPRWMPLPELLYAQVIKTVRRRRLVRVRHRVVFGTLEAVQQV